MYSRKILNWCLFKPDQLERLLETDAARGLSQREASSRQGKVEKAGRELRELFKPFIVFFKCLGGTLCDFSVLLLLLSSAVCTVIVGEGASALGVILLFVLFSAAVRAFIELYGKDAYKNGTDDDTYTVIRDGKRKRIKGSAIVYGDLIILSRGDIVPRDVRLIRTLDLNVIEKYDDKRVTAVEKDAEYYPVNPTGKIALRFKKNMLFKGSAVANGEGIGLVLDEITFEEASEVLCLSPDVRKVFEYEERVESSDIYTRVTGKSAFGTSAFGEGGYSDKTTVRAKTERLMTVARLCGLLFGTVVFILSLASRTLITDAFLFAASIMAVAPSVLYETCISASFFIGLVRLKRQGVYIRDFESAEKLALSKSVILCGSTGYKIESMFLTGAFFGTRSIELSGCNPADVKLFFEMLLCASDLELHDGGKTIKGDLEGLAVLDGAKKFARLSPREIREYIDGNERQYDLNGALLKTRINFAGSYSMILERGSVVHILERCDKHIDDSGRVSAISSETRTGIAKTARSLESCEGCKVVALCGQRVLPAPPGGTAHSERPIFIGFAVFGTKVSVDGTKYVDILRRNGIKPIIFSSEVSDAVVDNSRKLGIFKKGDNYITGKIYQSLDERIFKDEFSSYTLFMSLDSTAKRAIVSEKKHSEGVLAVAADRLGDAFDMSESDILISCGTDAPKNLRRISDIHSDNGGVDGIFRTICVCRNMIRGASLAVGYLMLAQVTAVVFSVVGAVISFINGGQLPMSMAAFLCAVFVQDLLVAMSTAFIKTPKSIINDDPLEFYAYYGPSRLVPKAIISGVACGLVSALSYLVGLLVAKSHEAGSLCAFTSLYFSKAFVSLVCIMPTSTRTVPAPVPVAAYAAEFLFGLLLLTILGAFGSLSAYLPIVGAAALMSVIPTVITLVYSGLDNKKSVEKKGKSLRK